MQGAYPSVTSAKANQAVQVLLIKGNVSDWHRRSALPRRPFHPAQAQLTQLCMRRRTYPNKRLGRLARPPTNPFALTHVRQLRTLAGLGPAIGLPTTFVQLWCYTLLSTCSYRGNQQQGGQ